MKAKTIGRVVGTGVRVAGRIAGERIARAGPRPGGTANLRAASEARRRVVQGLAGFLRPFRRAGGIVWLEVTGVFFLLPVIVFSPMIWATRASWEHGPDHRRFLASVILVAVFLYLSITSFWRARKRAATR
ncbi:MAG TPA: hypothetical protein VKU93_04945 [Terracidiphilus sp.]|jgi:hypothetical protein|nr:hypothetical protein [Terracidiphilus sp.]